MKNLIKPLIFLTLFMTFDAHASIDCRMWGRGFPDPTRANVEFQCTRFLTTNANVDFYVSDILSPSDQLEQMKTDIKEALVKSYVAYSRLGDMPKIKAVIYHRPHHGDGPGETGYAFAMTDWPGSEEACPVIIYPATSTLSRAYTKQLVAHEMFHCFQWKNYESKVDLGADDGIGQWWLEGTAQFMSNLVYPSIDMEYSPIFTAYDPRETLIDQEGYGNVHFFQSFYNQMSQEAHSIINFMEAMPATSGTRQIVALGNTTNITEIFHSFAKSMVTKTLEDSSGRIAPTRPIHSAEVVTIENLGGSYERDISVKPYTIHTVSLPLAKGYRYKISMDAQEGVNYSIRKNLEDTWSNFPIEFTTTCDSAEKFEILVTAGGTSLAPANAKLKVESEEFERCPCAGTTVDSCMIGNWELDPKSMEDFVRAVIGDEANVTSVEGFERMSFNNSGLAKVEMGWTGEGNGDMGGSQATVGLSLMGSYDVEIFRKERGLICSNMVRREVVGNMRVTTRGMTFNLPLSAGTPYDDTRERLNYTCNQRELVISATIPPGPNGSGRDEPININWRYLRK